MTQLCLLDLSPFPVQWNYNGFAQSIQTFQSHAGAVGVSTVSVGMSYANGAANTIRPTGLIYPNGRTVTYDYGDEGSIPDAASLVASLIDSDGGSTHLADYRYLGLGQVVQQDSPEANLQYTLVSLTGSDDPDTGDIYAGLDRFGRVKDCRWRNSFSNTDLSRVQYGYDRASSRIWRANPSDSGHHYDWLYGYDGLHRLKSAQRGTLNGGNTAITSPKFEQCWTLDATGNWRGFRQDNTGSGLWDLIQARTANPVNEITDVTNSTGPAWLTPEYDLAGNMTTIPKPAAPEEGFDARYDAWNRLVELIDSDSEDTVQRNAYDGRNYRVRRDDYVNGDLSEERHFYYTDGWQSIEERSESDPDNADPDRQHVWGVRYIDDLICRHQSNEGTLDERLYGCQDGNWNMTAVVDTNGDVLERYEYDPYGNTTILSSTFTVRSVSSFVWELTYAGYPIDLRSGLFVIRHRYYAPQIGLWLTRDPIHSTTNLYAMEVSLNGVDPFGLKPPKEAWQQTWSMQYLEWAGEESQKEPASILYGRNNFVFQTLAGFYSLVDTVPVAISTGSTNARAHIRDCAAKSDDPIVQNSMLYIGLPLSVVGELTAQGANTYSSGVMLSPAGQIPKVKAYLSNPYVGRTLALANTVGAMANVVDKSSEGTLTPSDIFFLGASATSLASAGDGVVAGRAAQNFARNRPTTGYTKGTSVAIRWPDGTISPGYSSRCVGLKCDKATERVQAIYSRVHPSARSAKQIHGACGEADAMSRRGSLSFSGGMSVAVDRKTGAFKPACPSCSNALPLQGISTPNDNVPFVVIQLLRNVSDFFQ